MTWTNTTVSVISALAGLVVAFGIKKWTRAGRMRSVLAEDIELYNGLPDGDAKDSMGGLIRVEVAELSDEQVGGSARVLNIGGALMVVGGAAALWVSTGIETTIGVYPVAGILGVVGVIVFALGGAFVAQGIYRITRRSEVRKMVEMKYKSAEYASGYRHGLKKIPFGGAVDSSATKIEATKSSETSVSGENLDDPDAPEKSK